MLKPCFRYLHWLTGFCSVSMSIGQLTETSKNTTGGSKNRASFLTRDPWTEFSLKRFKDKHFATLVDTIVPCKYKFGAVIHIERVLEELPLALKLINRTDFLKDEHFVEELREIQKKALIRKAYSEQELQKLTLTQRVKLVKAYQEDMDVMEYSFNIQRTARTRSTLVRGSLIQTMK